MDLNCFRWRKAFSTRCLYLYRYLSWYLGYLRFFFGGITGCIFCLRAWFMISFES